MEIHDQESGTPCLLLLRDRGMALDHMQRSKSFWAPFAILCPYRINTGNVLRAK